MTSTHGRKVEEEYVGRSIESLKGCSQARKRVTDERQALRNILFATTRTRTTTQRRRREIRNPERYFLRPIVSFKVPAPLLIVTNNLRTYLETKQNRNDSHH